MGRLPSNGLFLLAGPTWVAFLFVVLAAFPHLYAYSYLVVSAALPHLDSHITVSITT